MLMEDIALTTTLSERQLCDTLDLCRNTWRRQQQRKAFCGPIQPPKHCRKKSRQPRALTQQECDEVLKILNSEQYCNQPPAQVYYDLLQKGHYLCSISTMHRLLQKQNQSGERRQQRPAQSHAVPRLKASIPNEVWTWDITKLPTVKKGEYLCLYVVMDLFSRYIVAWLLSRKENSALASQLMQEATERYDIAPNSLTIHQDRGSPMIAHCYLDLLGELSITASHSRPRVSNDNPMSEAQFKTLKYQPDYPRRFEDYDHAMQWCEEYVNWYNHEHHHSSLAGFTPNQVFTGECFEVAKTQQMALDSAYKEHPERFSKGCPRVQLPPKAVFINPIPEDADPSILEAGVNFPTLARVKTKAI